MGQGCPLTFAGTLLSLVAPLPSWPRAPAAQQYATFADVMPQVPRRPAVIDDQLKPDAPLTGDAFDTRVPLPNCPVLLSPQQRTVPSLSNPQAWVLPVTRAWKVKLPITGLGVPREVPEPLRPSPKAPK